MLTLLLACAIDGAPNDTTVPSTVDDTLATPTLAGGSFSIPDPVEEIEEEEEEEEFEPASPGTGPALECGSTRLGETLALDRPLTGSKTTEWCDGGGAGRTTWTMDFDGDGAVDRVEVLPCDSDPVVRVWTGATDWESAYELPFPQDLLREDGSFDGRLNWADVDNNCGLDLVFSAWDEDTVWVYGQSAAGFEDPHEYTSWMEWMPGTDPYNSCSSGKSSRTSEGAWKDMDGDGDLDLLVLSDSCDQFGDASGWVPSKSNKLMGAGQSVSLSVEGGGGFMHVVDAAPTAGLEVVLVIPVSNEVSLHKLVGSSYLHVFTATLPEEFTPKPDMDSGYLGYMTCNAGGTGTITLRDLDGDGWGDLHFEANACADWWARGSKDGFGEQQEIEDRPGCGEEWMQLDARYGALAFADTCGEQEEGLGTEFVRATSLVD
jgi:hypothetical protein